MWANPTNMPSLKSTVILSVLLIVCVTLTVWGYGFIAGVILFLSAVVYDLSGPIKRHKTEFVDTPWGGYRNVSDGDGYKIKVLVILGGQATSLQSHKHRNEIWTIAKGTVKVTYGDKEFVMKTGETVKILSGFKHRITNDGEDPIVITEVWLGDILEEDDIIRYEDRYGGV